MIRLFTCLTMGCIVAIVTGLKMLNMLIQYATRQMAISKGLFLFRCEPFLYTKTQTIE